MAYAPRVRINPPLILTEEQADEAVALLDDALREVAPEAARTSRA
jgi:4-aminobutyrate aminotransferase-like enzyme